MRRPGKAWQEIVKADAANLPEVLKGMNGANPLAENWLRAAVGVIADGALEGEEDAGGGAGGVFEGHEEQSGAAGGGV
jgi:hypothetical protein